MLLAEDSIIDQYEFYERPSNDFTLQIRTGKTTEITISSSKEQHYDFLDILLKTYVYILEQMVIQGKTPEEVQFCKDETDIIGKKVIQPYQTLTEAISSAAKKYGDRVAIVDTYNKISYNELFKKILDGRYHLLESGIKKGDAVGICLGRSFDELVAIYSVILAGGIYVPFANVPLKRANYMIEQADVKLLITDGYSKEYACKCMDYRELFHNREEEAEIKFDCLPTDTAYILFTSGSTGVPKGCVISHGAITNRLCWNARALNLGADTKQLFKTPTTFDVSLVEIFSIFFAGHTLFVLPEGQEKNPERILNAISQYQINYLHFVPSMLRGFYEYIQEEEQVHRFDSVKTLVCSGEILPADLINKIKVSNAGIQIVNLYGPTEAAVDVSCYFAKDVSTVQTPIGKAIDNTVLLIVDHKQRKMPAGIGGEIYILGSNVGDGYIGQEDLSRKFFVQMKNGETAYRTGDYAYYLTDENIVVLGRKDEQVKYNGVRIEIPEIENAMMSTGLISGAAVVLQKKNRQD